MSVQTSRPPALKRKRHRIAIVRQPEEQLAWPQKVRRWLAGFAALGLAASLAFHAILLTLFAFWIIGRLQQDERLLLNGAETVGIDSKLEELPEISLDVEGGSQAAPDAALRPVPVPQPKDLTATVPATVHEHVAELADSVGTGDGTGEGEQTGDGADTGGRLPIGANPGRNAVTRGSFTAWTIPTNPREGQPYRIVVHVDVPPEKQRNYRGNDLSGSVLGTDEFACPLGRFRGGRLGPRLDYFPPAYYGRFSSRSNLFIIEIPGAERLVEDTIHIRSTVLDEEQTLTLVFGKPGRP